MRVVTNAQESHVKRRQLERLLHLVAQTKDVELSCSECFDLLPQYVDLEVTGAAPGSSLPLLRQHLEQCTDLPERSTPSCASSTSWRPKGVRRRMPTTSVAPSNSTRFGSRSRIARPPATNGVRISTTGGPTPR